MTTTSASVFRTSRRGHALLGLVDGRIKPWAARVRCTVVGHDFAAGIAGIVLQLPTCQRCGHDRES